MVVAVRMIFAVALFAVAAGCGGTDKGQSGADDIEAGDLVGTWTLQGQRLLFRFNGNGSYVFDRATLDAPYGVGTYEVDGSTITLTDTGSCPEGSDQWRWKADIAEDELHIVYLDPGCGVGAQTEWTFSRLPPP